MTEKIAKHKRVFGKRSRKASLQMLAAFSLLVGAASLQSCDKDILKGQPEWLGNSIYERLQEGFEIDGQKQTFNTTLRLIDDLNYKETLSKTGSKTVFVASDAQYDKWFQSNSWGVTSYDQLTTEQKKQIFNGSMINNAYLLELMSNVPASSDNTDPEEGKCMRRETAASIYDNVPQIKLEDFPSNSAIENDPVNLSWSNVRSQGKGIYVFKDATAAPMIHFLPEFMKMNSITDNDLKIISNGESTSISDAWINGKKVISDEQTCKNGYIYAISDVFESNPSMAEIINDNDQTKIWSRLLSRFSIPVAMDKTTQEEFWRLYPQCKGDSVYNLRYLNGSGNHSFLYKTGNLGDNIYQESDVLKFDPGWNQYKADNQQLIMQNDAAAMIVPTDEALTEWFTNGGGKGLYQMYGSWDAIPYKTISPLINVNMLESFTGSVPSKFASVLDDSQRSMGIQESDIVKCFMGCNGVVYLSNKVFEPSEYLSVIGPTTYQKDGAFCIARKALGSEYTGKYVSTNGSSKNFIPYLLAMDSHYSLIVPYNVHSPISSKTSKSVGTVFGYVDPCSYGIAQQYYWEFFCSGSDVLASVYPCTIAEDGTLTITTTLKTTINDPDIIANRLFDLIDNNIIIHSGANISISSDQQYYLTKSGSVMKALNQGGNMCFQGGFQLETGEKIIVPSANQYVKGNGITYGVSGDTSSDPIPTHVDIPMTARKSVKDILSEAAKNTGDTLFYSLIFDDPTSSALYKQKDGANVPVGGQNISLFDNYNYTVYVPTDAAIRKLIDSGYLPTWDYYENANSSERNVIADRIHNFVRYHFQDNSVYIGGEKLSNTMYETSKLNPETNRFYALTLTQDGNSLSITDGCGNVRHVVTSNGFYNKPCREYWVLVPNSKSTNPIPVSNSNVCQSTIQSSSNAVVHQIDDVLLYSSDQLTPWRSSSSAKRMSRRN